MRRDLKAAFEFLTRLPVGWLDRSGAAPDMSHAVWAYPLAGMAVAALSAAVYAALTALGEPRAVAAALAMAAQLALTGALHEDGLADTADGFGGGGTRDRKLAIMRDSRIGSFGAIALVLSLSMRAAAIASLGGNTPALVAAGALGRGAIVGLALLLPPARTDGLGAALGPSSPARSGAGLALAAASVLLLPGRAMLPALAAALAATCLSAGVARRQVGGHTGDVLGAAEQVAECAVLSVLAAALRG